MIKVDLSQFPKIINKVYYPIFKDTHRYLVLYGGAGSGKSVAAAQKIVYRMLTEKNHRFLCVRKIQNTIRDSMRAEIIGAIEKMGVRSLFIFSDSPTGEMSIIGPNNNTILFRGLDDPEKIKSIKDITGVWIEEASELKKQDFEQLRLRLRGKHLKNYKQIMLTFNPISDQHWLKKRFFDTIDEDAKVLKTTYLDNDFIDEEYKQDIEKFKDTNPSYYRVYALGEWGTLEGAIYPSYEVVAELPKYFEFESLGLDFGYNHPQALVHVCVDGKNAFIDEVYYERNKENGAMIEWVEKNRPDLKRVQCYADSARADLIEECRKAGWRIDKAKKDVFAGINAVKNFKLHITARSKNILKEIAMYCWRTDKDGNALDEPVKSSDDAMDAMRYAIFSALGRSGVPKSKRLEWL